MVKFKWAKKGKFKCPCGSHFYSGDVASVREHGGLCPPCYDLRQILAFARSAGDTLTADEALRVIEGIAATRLDRPRG